MAVLILLAAIVGYFLLTRRHEDAQAAINAKPAATLPELAQDTGCGCAAFVLYAVTVIVLVFGAGAALMAVVVP